MAKKIVAKKKPGAKGKPAAKTRSKAVGFTESVEAFLSKAPAPVLVDNLYAAVATGKSRKMLTKTVYRLLNGGRITRHGSGRASAFWGPGKEITTSTRETAKGIAAIPTIAKKTAGVTKTRAARKGGTRPIQLATRTDAASGESGTNATRSLLLNIIVQAEDKLRARALQSGDKQVRELAQHADTLRKALGSYL